VFSREPPVEFTLFSCNAKGDSAQHADVVFGMALVAGDRVVLEDPPFVVTVPGGEAGGRGPFLTSLPHLRVIPPIS